MIRLRSGARIQVTSVLMLVMFLAIALLPGTSAESKTQRIEWRYGMGEWYIDLAIPSNEYNRYHSIPVADRTSGGLAGYGELITTQDVTVRTLAADLKSWSEDQEYSMYDEVSAILAMIQQMEYTIDNVTTAYDEYPKYPLETLWDDGGDCEDTSILFCAVALLLEYDVVLLYLPPTGVAGAHMAVGIAGELDPGITAYPFEGKNYYFCETTGNGYRIGDIPQAYTGVAPQIIKPGSSGGSDPVNGSDESDGSDPSTPGYGTMSLIVGVGAAVLIWAVRRPRRS